MSNEELTLVAPVSDEELDALFARAASKKNRQCDLQPR